MATISFGIDDAKLALLKPTLLRVYPKDKPAESEQELTDMEHLVYRIKKHLNSVHRRGEKLLAEDAIASDAIF